MNKSKIEWLNGGYTINPVKGLCPVACPYCYARRMYKRFRWDETIRYMTTQYMIDEIATIKKPSKIFVGSTYELFHESVLSEHLYKVFNVVKSFPRHTFIFLTKQPQNLAKWSPFPANAWVGVSATNYWAYVDASNYLSQIEAKVKFISFEPLLSWDEKPSYFFTSSGISWVIIGACTPLSVKTNSKTAWIREIVGAADEAGVPVFLKDNLETLIPRCGEDWAWANGGTILLRQEMPLC